MQAARSFPQRTGLFPMPGMKTIAEIRLENLELLVEEFETADAVAERCGTSAVYLSQIRNQAKDSKTGKPRQIGDPLARKLETGCDKEIGWMDHQAPPRSYRSARIQHAVAVMEHMEDWQLDQAIKIVDTIAQPPQRQGNGN